MRAEYTPRETSMFFDAAWRAWRAFSIVDLICVGIGLITSVLLSGFALPRYWLDIVAVLYLLAALCFGLTFVAYASDLCTDYGCTFGIGSGLMIDAVLGCLIMTFLFYRLPDGGEDLATGGRSRAAANRSYAPGTRTISETKQADGTTKILKTTHNADGSKTVEETVRDARSGFW